MLLLEAKKIAENEGVPWKRWTSENIKRSWTDVRRLVAIAQAPDPAAALRGERKAIRERVTASRQSGAVRTAPAPQITDQSQTAPPAAPGGRPVASVDFTSLPAPEARRAFRALAERLGLGLCVKAMMRLLSIEEGHALMHELQADLARREAEIGTAAGGDPEAIKKALVPEAGALMAAPSTDEAYYFTIPDFLQRT